MRSRRLVVLIVALLGCGGSDAGALGDGGAGGPTTDSGRGDGSTVTDATVQDSPSLFRDADVPPAPEGGAHPPGVDGALPLPCADACPDGCCLPDNTCVTPGKASACGSHGEACVACAAGDTCDGTCVHAQAGCGPGNCTGCCLDANTCATTGTGEVACGSAGQACESCSPPGTRCLGGPDGGGFCPTCNWTCAGCCDDTQCTFGVSQTACGSGAAPCQTCTGGEQCVYAGTGGACVMPEAGACGPANCEGCCDGDVCAVGDQDIACGTGGADCVNCAMQPEQGSGAQTCHAGSCE